jgi:hypothetical protein
MYRVIYLDVNSEYQTFDSEDYNIIADSHLDLKRCGNKIICIVDYYYNVILNKCTDFKSHSPQIDQYTF